MNLFFRGTPIENWVPKQRFFLFLLVSLKLPTTGSIGLVEPPFLKIFSASLAEEVITASDAQQHLALLSSLKSASKGLLLCECFLSAKQMLCGASPIGKKGLPQGKLHLGEQEVYQVQALASSAAQKKVYRGVQRFS